MDTFGVNIEDVFDCNTGTYNVVYSENLAMSPWCLH